jgi:cell division protease FtsH
LKKENNKLKAKMLCALLVCLTLAFALLILNASLSQPTIEEVPFNDFVSMMDEGKVVEVEIGLGYAEKFTFTDTDGKMYKTDNPKSLNFKRELLDAGVQVKEVTESSAAAIIVSVLQYAMLIGVFLWMYKKMLPKTDNADVVKEIPQVTFDDVAGATELKNDLKYIIDYLKDSSHYTKLGAKMPKGIVLYGPPGTGKTLTAKAVAGTAGVPFFSVSGSDFIEMYVGLGAKRVRQLFKKAREAAPCIVFIDEIDAVGGSRNAAASHAEANQTINALLNELDGFNGKEGILVIAATNRLEDLDPALIRPGRFDKQLAVPLPEKEDRIAILKVHARNKTFEDDVNWDEIAATTVGFSGAAIASMLNEAAFIAASQRRDKISMSDIDRAIYKLLMKGDQKEDQSTRSKKELEICAYHESGHVIATKLYTNDRIPKVTIISSTSGAGGVTFRTPEETGLVSKAYLEGSVKMMYAGRAAEEIYFGNTDMITTGASSDIKQATEIIKSYIGVYGMSDEYGLINLAAFNNVNQEELIQKASTLAKTLYNEVRDDISRNKDLLEKLSTELLAHESLSESEIESIFNTIGLNK